MKEFQADMVLSNYSHMNDLGGLLSSCLLLDGSWPQTCAFPHQHLTQTPLWPEGHASQAPDSKAG